MQAYMEQPGDNLGPFSAPPSAPLSSRSHTTTGVEPAVVLAGQDHTITREVICKDSAGFIHEVPIWNGCGAQFSARTPHHLSGLLRGYLQPAARRKRTAMMQEHIARCIQGAKDSDDEENDDDTEGSDEEAERYKDMDDEPSVQNLRVYARSQIASGLRGDLDGGKK
ncbi:unnamed protein product [Ectocarpus sp. CCAP 1310/34]|nr:unnamed protein product [Ectocarpus sp. CCAP 1310/34]